MSTHSFTPTFLSSKNPHSRDDRIQFIEDGHKYIISPPEIPNPYTSVTTLVHENFSKFDADLIISKMMSARSWNPENKYWGMTPDEIKAQWAATGSSAAALGTELHYNIECFMNELSEHESLEKSSLPSSFEPSRSICSPEWEQFMSFYEDRVAGSNSLVPYRTEWVVFNEDVHLAGSIDMVFENVDDPGTLSIFDWKRVKGINENRVPKRWTTFSSHPCLAHIPDTNYWHYALQLNIYKAILEAKYDKKVTKLVLVRFHPNTDTYEETVVPNLQKEVALLFAARQGTV